MLQVLSERAGIDYRQLQKFQFSHEKEKNSSVHHMVSISKRGMPTMRWALSMMTGQYIDGSEFTFAQFLSHN